MYSRRESILHYTCDTHLPAQENVWQVLGRGRGKSWERRVAEVDVGAGRRARASPGRGASQLRSNTGLELDGERVPPLRPYSCLPRKLLGNGRSQTREHVLGQSPCTICQGLRWPVAFALRLSRLRGLDTVCSRRHGRRSSSPGKTHLQTAGLPAHLQAPVSYSCFERQEYWVQAASGVAKIKNWRRRLASQLDKRYRLEKALALPFEGVLKEFSLLNELVLGQVILLE